MDALYSKDMMTQTQKIALTGTIFALAGLALGGMVGYIYGFDAGIAQETQTTDVFPAKIMSFEDCVLAGYPIMESYPRQCRDEATGILYVEQVAIKPIPPTTTSSIPTPTPSPSPTPSPTQPATKDGCMVGGCSGQLCGEVTEIEGMVTTCEFRAEYACYKQSQCERQTTGKCGWSQTAELMACLANPPALQ